MKPLEHLKSLSLEANRQKYPNFPEHARPVEKYSDKTANGLTKCILHWLKFNGWHAERINTMGTPKDNRQIVTDVLGRQRQIGSIEWRRTTATKGSSDIHAFKKGLALYVEVKIGYDRISPAQLAFAESVETAGAFYYIAGNFNDFYDYYNQLKLL
jgi:hypothetical protein